MLLCVISVCVCVQSGVQHCQHDPRSLVCCRSTSSLIKVNTMNHIISTKLGNFGGKILVFTLRHVTGKRQESTSTSPRRRLISCNCCSIRACHTWMISEGWLHYTINTTRLKSATNRGRRWEHTGRCKPGCQVRESHFSK